MRSAIFLMTAALLFASAAGTPMSAQSPGVPAMDANTMFDFLAKGRNFFAASETRTLKADLEAFASANNLDPAKITREQFVAFMDARNGNRAKALSIKDVVALQPVKSHTPAEDVLRAAGLNADGDSLLAYFAERTRGEVNLKEMLALAQQLGEPDAGRRDKAVAKILGRGPWAVPALHHIINAQENPQAVQHARHCLEWLEGKRRTEVPVAAATLLAQRKPEAAAEILLAFLPLADDPTVLEGIKTALSSVAARPGRTDAALLAALRDPIPLRRAIAVEVLAGSGKPEVLPELRKLLADPVPQIQLRAALALTRQHDETAIEVLIELLAKLPASERRHAEAALRQLAGEWSPGSSSTGDDELSRKIRRDVWSAWWRAVDGPALLDAFRTRTLTAKEAAQAEALIAKLDDKSFETRELAGAELVAQGYKVAGLLRAAKLRSVEHARRVEQCLRDIEQAEVSVKLPLSAPGLLAARKPAGASDALLEFLPFSDDRAMRSEIVKSLTSLQRSQVRADEAIIKALTDPLSVRRIAAAEALVGAGGASHPSVRKLLADADPQVRLPVAIVLVQARDREAVPAMIELIAELPREKVQDVETLLRGLAGENAPVRRANDDTISSSKLRDAWRAWWKVHGAEVDLAVLERSAVTTGLLVVAELGPNRNNLGPAKKKGFGAADGDDPRKKRKGDGPAPKDKKMANQPANLVAGSDRLAGIDRNGQLHWQIDNLEHPIDFQMLPGDRVLIAEYIARRVTERDLKGKILWEVANLPTAPMNVQRLANGNTFIALYGTAAATGGYSLLEVDPQGKTVHKILGKGAAAAPGGAFGKGGTANPRGGYKMANGQMLCLTATGDCIRLDAIGREIKHFSVPSLTGIVVSLVGNLEVTPKGNVVIVHANNTVVEYDPDGKTVWKANVSGNRATRLANGNTLVASETKGVIELDASGKSIWQYQPPPGYQAVRAR